MSIPMLVLGLVAAGAAAGVLAGLLGIGGGIVIVPALYTLFSVLELDPAIRMPLAVGTSLSTIIVTATSSTRAHLKRGSVDTRILGSLAPGIVVGVVIGAVVAGFAPAGAMLLTFATVALIVALYMAFAPRGATVADGLPRGRVRSLVGTFIGAISSIMGIGGGTLTVPTLTLVGYTPQRAVGTGAAVGLMIAVPATLGMMIVGWGDPLLPAGSIGYVNLLGFAVLVPMTALMAPVGARLAHRLPPLFLKRAFALFLLVTSARMYMERFGLA